MGVAYYFNDLLLDYTLDQKGGVWRWFSGFAGDEEHLLLYQTSCKSENENLEKRRRR